MKKPKYKASFDKSVNPIFVGTFLNKRTSAYHDIYVTKGKRFKNIYFSSNHKILLEAFYTIQKDHISWWITRTFGRGLLKKMLVACGSARCPCKC